MSETLYDIPLQKIDGSNATLAEHEGEVLLIVNVASQCGLTPQSSRSMANNRRARRLLERVETRSD